MKALIFVFAAVMSIPYTAEAHTLCVNKVDLHRGMNFYATSSDSCPEQFSELYRPFRYSRVKNIKGCLFQSPRSKDTGDQLVCRHNLSIGQIEEIADGRSILKNNRFLKSWIASHKPSTAPSTTPDEKADSGDDPVTPVPGMPYPGLPRPGMPNSRNYNQIPSTIPQYSVPYNQLLPPPAPSTQPTPDSMR